MSPNTVLYLSLTVSPQFARGNLKLSEVLCESRGTILYRATAEGIRDKPIDVTVKAIRGMQCIVSVALPYNLCALRQQLHMPPFLTNSASFVSM